MFFTKIKELTFWQRIFSWRTIKSLSYDAFEEYKSLTNDLDRQNKIGDDFKNSLTLLQAENESLINQKNEVEKQILKKEGQIENLTGRVENLNSQVSELEKKLSRFESTEDERTKDYEKKIAQLDQVKSDLESRRKQLDDDRLQEQRELFDQMKKQWANHEDEVTQSIKQICQSQVIEYVDKVPFKGNPDNTIRICDEFIVFDAKSPANDDLTNFPKYVKAQTESVSKYTNYESVRNEIFLVVPSNTVDTIDKFTYNMGDYTAYVITKDSLEPVILSLKKIEEYEFAEQLSPEERDNICRILGKLLHTTKRKIQIDQFMNGQFLELLMKCSNDLPEDILLSVSEFEKAEKLNPPTERRTKEISTREILHKQDSLNAEAAVRGIPITKEIETIKETA